MAPKKLRPVTPEIVDERRLVLGDRVQRAIEARTALDYMRPYVKRKIDALTDAWRREPDPEKRERAWGHQFHLQELIASVEADILDGDIARRELATLKGEDR